MKKCYLTDSTDPGNVQTIGELWESVRFFAERRCEDNQLCIEHRGGEYPLEVRIQQMKSLQALTHAIEEFHTINSKEG